MDLKLFSAEIFGGSLQLTYTGDGQAPSETEQSLIVRLPMEGSFNSSLNWHRLNILERLHAWCGDEYNRVQEEMKKR